jgi:hypothetical protein
MGLTRQSLGAAAIAAYGGSVFMFALDMTYRVNAGSDARSCPVGSREITDICTVGEYAVAYLFTLLWAAYAFPIAIIFCLPVGYCLGRLAPLLEGQFSPRKVRLLQYLLATLTGFGLMFLFSALSGDADRWPAGLIGFIAGAIGVWVFRRMRYSRQDQPKTAQS